MTLGCSKVQVRQVGRWPSRDSHKMGFKCGEEEVPAREEAPDRVVSFGAKRLP